LWFIPSTSHVSERWAESFSLIGFAIDADKGAVWFSKNGTWMNSATASEIANSDVSKALRFGMPGPLVPLQYTHNGTTLTYNFGQKTFAYTPPTGYNSMQQDNLPETGKGIPDLHELMSVFWALFELGHHEELQEAVEDMLGFIRVDTDEERFEKIKFISNLYDEAYKGIPLGPWKEHYRTQLSMTYVLCQSYRTQNKWDEFKKALKGVELYSQWVGSAGNY